jgi:hypothetical protein
MKRLLVIAGTLMACSGPYTVEGDAAPSTRPTRAVFAASCETRRKDCQEGWGEDLCRSNYDCFVQAFSTTDADNVLQCVVNLTCGQDPDRECLAARATAAGKTFKSNCDDRAAECRISDDYCQEEAALYSDSVRAQVQSCLNQDCGTVIGCIQAILPACGR